MTNIKVALRFTPFSHLPGTKCPVPGTKYAIRAFPTRIEIYDLECYPSIKTDEINLNVIGPINAFTTFLDLEKGRVTISGISQKGYYRLVIGGDRDRNLKIKVLKSFCDPKELIPNYPIDEKNQIVSISKSSERLSLGCSKKQDWDLIARRRSLQEIIPFWLKLGEFYSDCSNAEIRSAGTLHFLKEAQIFIDSQKGIEAYEALMRAYSTSFEGILTPSLEDPLHQGIECPPLKSSDLPISPLTILGLGARVIRSMFLSVKENTIHVLPSLPPQFFCGRYLNITCSSLGQIDLDWTKKRLRRVIFRSKKEGEVLFIFPKELEFCRIKKNSNEVGRTFKCGDPLVLEEGTVYYFDRFEKK